MGLAESKILATTVLTFCQRAEGEGKARLDECSGWNEAIIQDAGKLCKYIPPKLRGRYSQSAINESISRASIPVTVPAVVQELQEKRITLFPASSVAANYEGIANDTSPNKGSLAGLYTCVKSCEKNQELNNIRLRVLYVAFHRLAQVVSQTQHERASYLAEVILESGSVSDTIEKVRESVNTWIWLGGRYSLIAGDLGGSGVLYILPNLGGESLWKKELPKDPTSPKRIKMIELLKQIKIPEEANNRGLHAIAEDEIARIVTPTSKLLFSLLSRGLSQATHSWTKRTKDVSEPRSKRPRTQFEARDTRQSQNHNQHLTNAATSPPTSLDDITSNVSESGNSQSSNVSLSTDLTEDHGAEQPAFHPTSISYSREQQHIPDQGSRSPGASRSNGEVDDRHNLNLTSNFGGSETIPLRLPPLRQQQRDNILVQAGQSATDFAHRPDYSSDSRGDERHIANGGFLVTDLSNSSHMSVREQRSTSSPGYIHTAQLTFVTPTTSRSTLDELQPTGYDASRPDGIGLESAASYTYNDQSAELQGAQPASSVNLQLPPIARPSASRTTLQVSQQAQDWRDNRAQHPVLDSTNPHAENNPDGGYGDTSSHDVDTVDGRSTLSSQSNRSTTALVHSSSETNSSYPFSNNDFSLRMASRDLPQAGNRDAQTPILQGIQSESNAYQRVPTNAWSRSQTGNGLDNPSYLADTTADILTESLRASNFNTTGTDLVDPEYMPSGVPTQALGGRNPSLEELFSNSTSVVAQTYGAPYPASIDGFVDTDLAVQVYGSQYIPNSWGNTHTSYAARMYGTAYNPMSFTN